MQYFDTPVRFYIGGKNRSFFISPVISDARGARNSLWYSRNSWRRERKREREREKQGPRAYIRKDSWVTFAHHRLLVYVQLSSQYSYQSTSVALRPSWVSSRLLHASVACACGAGLSSLSRDSSVLLCTCHPRVCHAQPLPARSFRDRCQDEHSFFCHETASRVRSKFESSVHQDQM